MSARDTSGAVDPTDERLTKRPKRTRWGPILASPLPKSPALAQLAGPNGMQPTVAAPRWRSAESQARTELRTFSVSRTDKRVECVCCEIPQVGTTIRHLELHVEGKKHNKYLKSFVPPEASSGLLTLDEAKVAVQPLQEDAARRKRERAAP